MNKKDLDSISDNLIKREDSLAVAESVTSGLCMATLSLAKDATLFFQGGMTVYNLGQKTRHLAIDPIHGEKSNCVSNLVAEQMATEVSHQFCAQWGIGITGYAAPVPELNIKVCFVIFSFAYNGKIVLTSRIETRLKGQALVQKYFTDKILHEFATQLKSE